MVRLINENKRSFYFPLCVFTIATALIFFSCRSSEAARSEVHSTTSVPSDFQLLMGEGGGFSGQWSGFLVDSMGTISSWQGTSPGTNAKQTTRLTRPEFERLWQLITDSRFFEIDTTGTGNMTVAMQVTARGTAHRTSWAKPPMRQTRPSPVQTLYDSCRTILTRGNQYTDF